MLRITKLTDYAILIMSALAKDETVTLSARILAEELHLTLPTVSKILKMLAEGKLVHAIRGVDGGYHLARSASRITLAEVIAAMEGDLAMTPCCEPLRYCPIELECSLKENWRKINLMIKTLLSQFTLDDMLKPLALSSRKIENG